MASERCYAEVDLTAAAHNYRILRTHTAKNAKILCVVKADAYGHGAVPLARVWEELGAAMFAVATVEEAYALRAGGIHTPCLLFGYAPPTSADILYAQRILPGIYSVEDADAWDTAAEIAGIRLPCHLKVNTGMNRLGISHDDIYALKHICRLPHLDICGIYSHLYASDAHGPDTSQQLATFRSVATCAEGISGHILTRHIANTDAILRHRDTHLDMVRAGIGLYGYTAGVHGLLPVMRFLARVIQIRELPRGAHVGYGVQTVLSHPARVATLAVGYADGLRRDSGRCRLPVTLGGVPCPLIGNACMDMCMADISSTMSPVHVGDYAVLWGGNATCGADTYAAATGTIPYEVLTSVGGRVKRIYTPVGGIAKNI